MASSAHVTIHCNLLSQPAPDPNDQQAVQGYLRDPSWQWIPVLRFSSAEMNEMHVWHRPYQWCKYAIGVVVGGPGELSTSKEDDTQTPSDVASPWPSHDVELYFHMSDTEKARMLVADTKINNERTTSGGSSEPREHTFRQRLVDRDGSCVLSGFPSDICIAAHLISHSKGVEYLEMFTTRSLHMPNGPVVVDDIDDTRNGLLLVPHAHARLGQTLAFMRVPNFAIGIDDVPDEPARLPDQPAASAAGRAEVVVTHILETEQIKRHIGGPGTYSGHGSFLRLPGAMETWPTPVLFDATYAQVLMRYSTDEFSSFGQTMSKYWYTRDDSTDAEDAEDQPAHKKTSRAERLQRRNMSRAKTPQNQAGDVDSQGRMHSQSKPTQQRDPIDLLLFFRRFPPVAGLSMETYKAELAAAKQASAEAQDRVRSWVDSVSM